MKHSVSTILYFVLHQFDNTIIDNNALIILLLSEYFMIRPKSVNTTRIHCTLIFILNIVLTVSGMVFIMPYVDRCHKVDIRMKAFTVPPQQVGNGDTFFLLIECMNCIQSLQGPIQAHLICNL